MTTLKEKIEKVRDLLDRANCDLDEIAKETTIGIPAGNPIVKVVLNGKCLIIKIAHEDIYFTMEALWSDIFSERVIENIIYAVLCDYIEKIEGKS